jgi:hypothetical protein
MAQALECVEFGSFVSNCQASSAPVTPLGGVWAGSALHERTS